MPDAFSIGGVLLQLFAPSLAAFVIGRFWNALSYGAATAIVPLLLGDIVPPSIRGAAVQASSVSLAYYVNVLTICLHFHLSNTDCSHWIRCHWQSRHLVSCSPLFPCAYKTDQSHINSGTDKIQGPWSYHVPLIIQAVFPVFLAIMTV